MPTSVKGPQSRLPTASVRGSSSAKINCSSNAIIVRRPETSEFKRSINTAIYHPHSFSQRKNDYRTPSSSSCSEIWISSRCLLWFINWNPDRVFRCCCVLVLNPFNGRCYNHWQPLFHPIDILTPALGRALACAGQTLVYGGGSNGIMGVVSGEVLLNGGKVIGVVPRDMIAGGGEGKKAGSPKLFLNEVGREKVLWFFS